LRNWLGAGAIRTADAIAGATWFRLKATTGLPENRSRHLPKEWAAPLEPTGTNVVPDHPRDEPVHAGR
jgi:hypothetical protein